MPMTVTRMTAFLAVIRGGSVTAAADELVVTQPSVSSAVAVLGRELGCDLFERAGRGIRLTEAGTAFAPYAADVLGLIEQGRQAAREAAAVVARRLQIAAVTTAAESFVPPLMRAFSEAHPGIELTLAVGNPRQVLDRVLNHSVDVAISGKPPDDGRLIAQPLTANEIVRITAPEDPAATERPFEATELADRPWLLREPGSGTRTLNEQFLAERRIEPRTLTLDSNGAIKQAARAGLGIALLSRDAVEGELASGCARPLARCASRSISSSPSSARRLRRKPPPQRSRRRPRPRARVPSWLRRQARGRWPTPWIASRRWSRRRG